MLFIKAAIVSLLFISTKCQQINPDETIQVEVRRSFEQDTSNLTGETYRMMVYLNQCPIRINVQPQKELSTIEWAVILLSSMYSIFCLIKIGFLRRAFRQKFNSYLYLVMNLYWLVALQLMVSNPLLRGTPTAQLIGKIFRIFIIASVVIFLNGVDRDKNTRIQNFFSFLFQITAICFSVIDFNFFYRIVVICFTTVPYLQICHFIIYKKLVNIDSSVAFFHSVNIGCYAWLCLTVPGLSVDPFLMQNQDKVNLIAWFGMIIIFINPQAKIFHRQMWYLVKGILLRMKKSVDKRRDKLLPVTQICTICLNQMDPYLPVMQIVYQIDVYVLYSKTLTRLSCGHTYHTQCIGLWFKQRQSCPIEGRQIPFQEPK